MRKFLALVLALVMTMSLVTVSAGAATDFADDADIKNEEAVEVLNAMGVLTGNNGKFNPNGKLTRGAGAKIIAYLMLGQAKADKLTATYTVFEDVTDTVGLAAYIEWAAANNIVGGYGDGKFGPYDTLTEYAFGKMLLAALGYSAKEEGYTGAGWQKNVYRDANFAGIYDGTESYGACTRDTAARMALGALLADIVVYGNKDVVGNGLYWNGNLIYTGTGTAYGRIDTGVAMWEFYDKLTYTEFGLDVYGRPGHKWTYGRTFAKFYMDAPVAEYTKAVAHCDLLVAAGLPKSAGTALNVYNYDNGALKAGQDAAADTTTYKHSTACIDGTTYGGQGVLTQVFELANGEFIITEIDTYLAQVNSVKKTMHNTTGNTGLNVYVDTDATFGTDAALTDIVASGNIGFAKNDFVLVNLSEATAAETNVPAFMQTTWDDDKDPTTPEVAWTEDYKLTCLDAADYAAQLDNATYTYVGVVGAPEVLSNAKFSGANVNGAATATVTVNGVKTPMAAQYELTVGGFTYTGATQRYNYFVDQYDNVIGDTNVSVPYAFGVIESVEWFQTPGSKVADYVEAYVVGTDATVKMLETYEYNSLDVVNAEDAAGDPTNNTFAQVYTKNTAYYDATRALGVVKVFELDDGGYGLSDVAVLDDNLKLDAVIDNAGTATITSGDPVLDSATTDAYADEDTMFVVASLNAKGETVYASYTGIHNVPSMKNASFVAVYEDATGTGAFNTATFVYVDLTAGYFTGKDDIAVITDTAAFYYEVGKVASYYAWIDGVKTEIFYTDDTLFGAGTAGIWELHYSADGFVTSATQLAEIDSGSALAGVDAAWDTKTVTTINGKVVNGATDNLHMVADTKYFTVSYLDANDDGVFSNAADAVLSVEAADADAMFVGAELVYTLKTGTTDNFSIVYVMVPYAPGV